MKSLSSLSSALIIASAIILAGNVVSVGLSDVAAAAMGFAASSQSTPQTILLFALSAILFAAGLTLALASHMIEAKHR